MFDSDAKSNIRTLTLFIATFLVGKTSKMITVPAVNNNKRRAHLCYFAVFESNLSRHRPCTFTPFLLHLFHCHLALIKTFPSYRFSSKRLTLFKPFCAICFLYARYYPDMKTDFVGSFGKCIVSPAS